jgi:hypothetical protein
LLTTAEKLRIFDSEREVGDSRFDILVAVLDIGVAEFEISDSEGDAAARLPMRTIAILSGHGVGRRPRKTSRLSMTVLSGAAAIRQAGSMLAHGAQCRAVVNHHDTAEA